jgi:hypothetical protein
VIPFLGKFSKECKPGYNLDICKHVPIAALFIINKKRISPTTDEWIKKMEYTYAIEYYSAMKKN